MRDVHEGCGLQGAGLVPACSGSGQGFGQWQPLPAPHTGRANCRVGQQPGRVTSWKKGGTLARSLTVDGDSGLLHDGEGWTPRKVHQWERQGTPICYRPLRSEQLVQISHSEAVTSGRGEGKAFNGRWLGARSCTASARAADSVRSSTCRGREGFRANDGTQAALRSRPRRRSIEASRRRRRHRRRRKPCAKPGRERVRKDACECQCRQNGLARLRCAPLTRGTPQRPHGAGVLPGWRICMYVRTYIVCTERHSSSSKL